MAPGKNPALRHVSGRRINYRDERHLLKNTKQDSNSHKPSEVLNESRAGHDNAPANDENPKVRRRTFELHEKDVAWYFEEDVGNKD